jgi:2,3-bisphosphoglycerate-independent phosphoglycerate mutase
MEPPASVIFVTGERCFVKYLFLQTNAPMQKAFPIYIFLLIIFFCPYFVLFFVLLFRIIKAVMPSLPLTRSVLLCILDGWGESALHDKYDAIKKAKTPNWDRIRQKYPTGFLKSWGKAVGLPETQMGNSEVGHTNIGAGRIVEQSLGRINESITNNSMAQRPIFKDIFDSAREGKKPTIHLAGLFSDGGVHSHISHMSALTHLLHPSGCPIALHIFLDGRDCAPGQAQKYLEHFLKESAPCHIASISGRYFAMDRDKNWERTEKAYRAIMLGQARYRAETASIMIQDMEKRGEGDEFAEPTIIGTYDGVKKGDIMITSNFRADRMRQLFTACGDPAFDAFGTENRPALGRLISMMPYWSKKTPHSAPHIKQWHECVFEKETIKNGLGHILAKNAIKQFRIAETEKYAHVTFFFNGGDEETLENETRILIPSPKVNTYDQKPEMSANAICDQICSAMEQKHYRFLLANFANPDMVGHTGNMEAAIKAVEAVDYCLGKIIDSAEKSKTTLLITADHGNVETMWDEKSQKPHTAHTINPVPFVYCGENYDKITVSNGILGDVAPTILALLNIKATDDITGKCLLTAL